MTFLQIFAGLVFLRVAFGLDSLRLAAKKKLSWHWSIPQFVLMCLAALFIKLAIGK
jgi:hypothetical protein